MKSKKLLLLLLPTVYLLTGCDVNISSEDFISKLVPNWASFVAQLGALLVLIFVVITFAYKPVKKIVKARQDYIENTIKEAEENKAIWEDRKKQSEETVLASTKKATQIITEAKESAEIEKQKIVEETAKQVQQMKIKAEEDIAKMRIEAEEEIRQEMVEIALAASSQILAREVDEKDHSRFVKEFIEEIKKEE